MGRLCFSLGVLAACVSPACGSRAPGSGTHSATSGGTGNGETGVRSARSGGAGAALTDNGSALPDDQVQGFVTASAGELNGNVVDTEGHPVANAPVHLVTKHGQRTVTTDKQGRFKTEIGEPTMVVVYGGAQVNGSTVTTQRIAGAEAFDVQEILPPAKLAKPLSNPTEIPEYSDAIRDKDAWARAWLLLEVSATGVVTRVKLLNPPGHDLDTIAVRHAFKLTFEPARDRTDKPVPSHVVWKFEWPPSVWNRGANRLRAEAFQLPCRGSATDTWYKLNTPYRDCSPPNMAAAITAPWIDRSKK